MSFKESIKKIWMTSPRYSDVFILAVFTVLITWNPYFAHGKINIFEVGLYLPGIQAILNSEIPYRDFFHLRGPFELYMPAFLMNTFGMHLKVMFSYFYFGNVLCLILCTLIAKEILKTRFVLYLMTFVLIGRTFPRVVFTFWGGMRYAFGLLALWLVIKFFKHNKPKWMIFAGIASALGLFTSIEMGIYPLLGVLAALIISKFFNIQDSKLILRGLGAYCIGLSVVAVPYGIYLASHSALFPYVDSVLTIVTRMQEVIDPHIVSVYPRNFTEAFVAMTNPMHTNFKHMTPSYLYIFILSYLILRLKRKTFSREDLMIVCLGVYGFTMYNTGFRGIWAAQFEMALQPEKVLLFFLLERTFFYISMKKSEYINGYKDSLPRRSKIANTVKIYGINFLIFAFIMSSVWYSMARYNHRFFAYKFIRDKLTGRDTEYLKPLVNEQTRALNIDQARGIIVPVQQADELEQIDAFVRNHVAENEILFTYPELGTYNFFFDRRFFGKYPLATFTWFNDRWHDEYLTELNLSKPEYVIVQKDIAKFTEGKGVYSSRKENRKKFRDVMSFISAHYRIESVTALSNIYKRK